MNMVGRRHFLCFTSLHLHINSPEYCEYQHTITDIVNGVLKAEEF